MALIRLAQVSWLFHAKYWRVFFVLMLLLLHLCALRGAGDFWARALMLAHFGLFILWQPFMRGEQRLNPAQIIALAVLSAGILLFLNWWLLALWVGVLAGIVGGKVFLFQAPWLRRFHLVVLAYLVALLLVWIVPNTMLDTRLPLALEQFTVFGLPVLFLVMLLIPAEADSAETPQIVDFFYAMLLFLLFVVLVLGSFTFMRINNLEYWEALTVSLLVIAAVLLALSLAWNPRAGFGGLSMYFSRYLLSIGLPFEQWLFFIAELSQLETRPERLLKEATEGLARLPWVSGGQWRTQDHDGEFGSVTRNSVEYTNQLLHIRVFTKDPLSPSLLWHFHLLGQLLGEFYVAKQREQKLQQQTYVQAVHETGARMTHDVKNLLQSLNAMCSAVDEKSDADAQAVVGLLRRQLPEVSRRLQSTLDRLQKPQTDSGRFESAKTWWEDLKRTYRDQGIEFVDGALDGQLLVPKELFDSAGDNLVQNALRKRKLDEAVSIEARLDCANGVEFSVTDSGTPVDATILRGLLHGPVPSSSGFGIGLYQTAKLAELAGFNLKLTSNEHGRVRFSLTGSAAGQPMAQRRPANA